MNPRPTLLGILVATLLTAGCIGGGADLEPAAAPAAQDVLATLDRLLPNDHDHWAPDLHPEAGLGLRQLWHGPAMDSADRPIPVGEIDVRGGYAALATIGPGGGFMLYDLADPAAPVEVGRFNAGTAYAADVKLSDDARWAFVGTEPGWFFLALFAPEQIPGATVAGLLSGGPPMIADYGIQIVDLSDKASPRLAGIHATPDPTGYHMIDVEKIDGELYVFGAVIGIAGRVEILRFETAPAPHLELVGTYQTPEARDPGNNFLVDFDRAVLVHDMTVEPDPLTGEPLLTVAYWHGGIHFVDVTDPTSPEPLGVWNDFTIIDPANVHTAKVTAVDGRRIAVAIPELMGYGRQGVVWVVDATDYAQPTLLGTWAIPGEHPITETYVYSTHNVEVRNGTIYMAHFHAGAYVLDISTLEAAAEPQLLAYLLPPAVPEPVVALGVIGYSPAIWDAFPVGDLLYLADTTGGLRVARLEASI